MKSLTFTPLRGVGTSTVFSKSISLVPFAGSIANFSEDNNKDW